MRKDTKSLPRHVHTPRQCGPGGGVGERWRRTVNRMAYDTLGRSRPNSGICFFFFFLSLLSQDYCWSVRTLLPIIWRYMGIFGEGPFAAAREFLGPEQVAQTGYEPTQRNVTQQVYLQRGTVGRVGTPLCGREPMY